MKKTLIFLLGMVFAVLTLGACNKDNSNPTEESKTPTATNKTEEPAVDYDKVLAAEEGYYFNVVGGLKGDWEPNSDNKMEATSVSEVAKLDKDLADTLKTKKLQYLYIAKGYELNGGLSWTANVYKDGKQETLNGGYTIKAIRSTFEEVTDEETGDKMEIWSSDQWIPDPKTAHAESLTEDTLFIPMWRETDPDGDGKGIWSENPVCIGGAGKYTFVVAQYKAVSSESTPGFGMALILEEEIEEIKATEVKIQEEYDGLKAGTIKEATEYEFTGKIVNFTTTKDEEGKYTVNLIVNINGLKVGISKAVEEAGAISDINGLKKEADITVKGKINKDSTVTIGEETVDIDFADAVVSWTKLPANASVFFVKGSMNGWAASYDGCLVLNEAKDTASVTMELAAGVEFKIADATWTPGLEFNYTAVADNENFEDNGGNIKVKVAGTYTFTITGYNATSIEGSKLTVTKK